MAPVDGGTSRLRHSGLATLLLLGGWPPLMPAQPPLAADSAPSEWERLKVLWREMEGEDPAPADRAAELAACLDLQPYELERALHATERQAAGMPTSDRALSPTRYALTSLAMAQILLLPEARRLEMTRMAYFPPWIKEEQRLRAMENPTVRVEELRTRCKSGQLSADTLLTALAGIEMDLYHIRALRLAAEAHAKHHRASESREKTPLEALAERHTLTAFLAEPKDSALGSEPWLREFPFVMEALARELSEPESSLLRQRAATLATALRQLEEARPRLELLLQDLERPAP